MNLEQFRNYCLSKKAATEDLPFDETTLAFRIGNKIFAITDLERLPFRVNLKCDPERAVEMRERYDCVTPGYHMNKKHWNSIEPDSDLPDEILIELIDHSYDLVFSSLKKSERDRIINL